MAITQQSCRQFIGGDWRDGSADAFEVTNSSTGEVVAEGRVSTSDDVDAAVRAGSDAFPAWSRTPVTERVQVFFRYKALLERHAHDIARLITIEHGKTLNEALGSLRRGIEVVDMVCGMPMLLKGETLPNAGGGVDYTSYRYPLGVCAGITPFNFPAMIPLWMFPVAIACGNTFILKPSPQTPLTAVRLVELLVDAGLPDGVINLVHGGKEPVEALLAHPKVRAVSFVGSTPVARHIYAVGTANGKRVQAAGGAKNHIVVLQDAPVDATLDAILASGFGCAGERCMAVSNVIMTDASADKFMDPLIAATAAMRVGRTDNGEKVGMGPLVSDAHLDRVLGYLHTGVKEGAELVHDGRKTTVPPDGFFIGPSIFDRVEIHHTIARDEIFGPVLSVFRTNDLDAAIDQINANPYGNAACLFTSSGAAARRFRERVNVGMIGINVGVPAPAAYFPFSGWNESFFGDLHVQGMEGIAFYTQNKVVMTRWAG